MYLLLFAYQTKIELEKSEVKVEIQKFRTKYKNLWRSANNSMIQELKFQMLGQWTKELSISKYLKRAKKKQILVYRLQNGRNLNLRCQFLTQAEQAALNSKCIFNQKGNKTLENLSKQDAVIIFNNLGDDICSYENFKDAETVFFIKESPFTVKCANFSKNNPILGSYWGGSDIVIPYEYFSKFSKPKEMDKVNINFAENKTEFAVILVSNCNSSNDRLGFVTELQKYIPIDVYGNCGPKKCPKLCPRILKKYKFYLAFENENCRDYITQQFWDNALRNDVVPVVMGAHPDDYKRLVPPNSYIHVEDFSSMTNLVDYLLMLDENDELYNKYFENKRFGSVQLSDSLREQFLCQFCAMLHFEDILPQPFMHFGNYPWEKSDTCLPLKKWYWNKE